MFKESKDNPKVSAKMIAIVSIPVALIILTMLLPYMFPDSQWINFLFGQNKFLLFWMVIACVFVLFLSFGRPKRPEKPRS